MKVGIYNTYLSTMGGGEQHMGAIAKYFIDKHGAQVDLITEKAADLEAIAKKLHLNLEGCNLVVHDNTEMTLEERTEQYDLFVNSTFYSKIKPRATHNAILLFFPIAPEVPFLAKSQRFKSYLTAADKQKDIHYVSGFYGEEKIGKGIKRQFGHWTKQTFSFSVTTTGAATVSIETLPFRPEKLENIIEGVRCGKQTLNFSVTENTVHIEVGESRENNTLTVELSSVHTPKENTDTRELGMFVKHISTNSGKQSRIQSLAHQLRYYNYLSYYDTIIVNSEYTRGWLQNMWKTDAHVLYPIIQTDEFRNSSDKKNIILSVGRFFEGTHNKKHLVMIRAFKELFLEGKVKGWEYHICGGTHPEPQHQEYLEQVLYEATGYPITVHPDIPFHELKELYSTARIFWHASGFGEDETKHPERFEHFGITTAEAMSAGAIPIVIGKAGQKEIVNDGENGFLWNSLPEFKLKTENAMGMNENALQQLSHAAQERSETFNREACYKRLDEIFANYFKHAG